MGDYTYYSLDFTGDGITEEQVEELKKHIEFDDAYFWPAREYKTPDGKTQTTTPSWQLSVGERRICECEDVATEVLNWLRDRGLEREFTVEESGYNGGDLGTRCVYTPGRPDFFTVNTCESGPVIVQHDLERLWRESDNWSEMLTRLKDWFGPESEFNFKPDETLASVLKGEA